MNCKKCKGNYGVCNCQVTLKIGDIVRLSLKAVYGINTLLHNEDYVIENIVKRKSFCRSETFLYFENCFCGEGLTCLGHIYNPLCHEKQFYKVNKNEMY